jgi:transcriptional regulator of aromatic amino acid metabolism
MSDIDLARRVRQILALLLDDIDTVQVEVEHSVVYLEGVAVNAAEKQKIDQHIRRLPGVREVVNCLSLEHVACLATELNVTAPHPPIPTLDFESLQPGNHSPC